MGEGLGFGGGELRISNESDGEKSFERSNKFSKKERNAERDGYILTGIPDRFYCVRKINKFYVEF